MALAGIAIIIAGAFVDRAGTYSGPIALLAIGVIFFGIIGGVVGSQVLVPRKIDKNFVWLKKVSPEYLKELPGF